MSAFTMIRPKSFLISIAILISLLSFSQEKQLDIELYKLYQDVINERFKEELNWDSIEIKNNIFKNRLLYYLTKDSATLSYKFDSLRTKITITQSDDGLLRIYSWNSWLGGTMQSFNKVFQFKTTYEVSVKSHDNTQDDNQDFDIGWYSNIYTLENENKKYYLAVCNSIYSTIETSQSIKVFSIENETLKNDSEIFKVNDENLNSIDVFFDFFSVIDRPERPVELIKYDQKNKIISIPVIEENGKVTDDFIIYKFNGKYFEVIEKH